MAGVAGRSGGGKRTLTALSDINNPKAKLPDNPGKPKPDWYLYDTENQFTREQIFKKISALLERQGVCTADDGMLVSMITQQYYVLQHAALIYDQDGPAALIGRALASRIISDCQKEIRILLAEFYVTPTTRSKIPGKDAKDDLADFLMFKH